MIKLEVEKYCENCPEFEAVVDKTSYGLSPMQSIHKSLCNTVISCEHGERCRVIMDYLSREKK